MSLANNLKYLRLQHKLSQDYIAELLEYKSFTTIQKWESGISEPPLDKLKVLADLYQISINRLLDDDLSVSQETDAMKFTSVQDALKFIIEQPMIAAYGGYDLDTMTDDEILEFANDIADMIEIAARKYKRKQ